MKKGFTLIELLAVIVILAIVALIATPLILNVIDDVKERTFNIEATNIEKAAEFYLTDGLKIEDIPKYQEYYIPVSSLTNHIKKLKDEMLNEYVIVKKTDSGISYYYTGRDKNPYLTSRTLKEAIESDSDHIVENTVNGITVNKVFGIDDEKKIMKNWVWFSGQLWQVLETTDDYVKLITANSVTSIVFGESSDWQGEEGSWVRKWLNEIDPNSNQDGIFYHSLSRTDLLLDGNFCLDEPANLQEAEFTVRSETREKVTGFTPISNCVNIVTDKIGLMTFEDYVYSLNGTDGISGALGGSYLDEDEVLWTMTKYTEDGSTNKLWHTYYYFPSHIEHEWNTTDDYALAVRPVIYLSADLKIEEIDDEYYGTIWNPYRLVGEQKANNGDNLNSVTIGSFIYLSEEKNPYDIEDEYIRYDLWYTYDSTKVRYRVIGIDGNGNIRVQRSDVLKDLPEEIFSMDYNMFIPYYYEENTCNYKVSEYAGCNGHNIFDPTDGDGNYNYSEGDSLAYFLNNAPNSFYNWFSDKVKDSIVTYNWNLPVGAHQKDYVESLFNFDYNIGEYPYNTNDGVVSAKIGLPQWGDMFSGNDLDNGQWYINRWPDSSTDVSEVNLYGDVYGDDTSTISGVRPVLYLKSDIKITGGEGTPANPYTLSIE